jgi:hypothetical protein
MSHCYTKNPIKKERDVMEKETWVARKIPRQNQPIAEQFSQVIIKKYGHDVLYCQVNLWWIRHRPSQYQRLFRGKSWAK